MNEAPKHGFQDPGPPCGDPDYRAKVQLDPEKYLSRKFLEIGADYGGKLPADFALSAMLR